MPKTMVAEAFTAEETNASLLKTALERFELAARADPGPQPARPWPAVIEALQDESLTAIEVVARACEAYAERPALGERAFTLDHPASGQAVRHLPEFRTITYRTAWERTTALATGLVRDRRTGLKAGETVGIFGFGSVDYVIADLACLYVGCVSAVLQTSLPAEDLQHLVNEAEYACIICAHDGLPAILALLPACPSVRSVVVMDFHGESIREAAELDQARAQAPVPLPSLAELAAIGRGAERLAPFRPAPGSDPLATLMYTSGSTGFPKGAMLTQRIWRSHMLLLSLREFMEFPHVALNFYPLSHAMGRNSVLRSIVLGGVTHFTLKSDMSTLFEDIRLVRPTFLNLVPRISEMIHQAYRAEVQRRLKAGAEPAAAAEQVAAAMRSTFLGDRLVAAVVGSAPTAPEVIAFLSGCFADSGLRGLRFHRGRHHQRRRPDQPADGLRVPPGRPARTWLPPEGPALAARRAAGEDPPVHPRLLPEHRRDPEPVRPGRLPADRRHRRGARARTTSSGSTARTTSSSCPRASTSPSGAWRPPSAPAVPAWSRSTCMPTASAPTPWPWWCRPGPRWTRGCAARA